MLIWHSLDEQVQEEGAAGGHYLNGHYYPDYDMRPLVTTHLQYVRRYLDGHMGWGWHDDDQHDDMGDNHHWHWRVEREQLLLRNENRLLLRYLIEYRGPTRLQLRLRPLLAMRNFHQLQRVTDGVSYLTETSVAGSCYRLIKRQGATAAPDGAPASTNTVQLYLQASRQPARRVVQNCWYYNVLYPTEHQRGYLDREDLFCPEYLEFNFDVGRYELIIAGGVEEPPAGQDLKQLWYRELTDRHVERLSAGPDLMATLRAESHSFLVRQQGVATKIMAGYPWFLSWGRDTMIALPGLTLGTRLLTDMRSILSYYARQLRDGLIPNYLGPTASQHAYNSVDASLWWTWALWHYWLAIGRKSAQIIAQFGATLAAIWRAYTQGGPYNLHVDDRNGLLYAGGPQWNLTWMDAAVGGRPVTPRYGFSIELNALWYHLLRFVQLLHSSAPAAATGIAFTTKAVAGSWLTATELQRVAQQRQAFAQHFKSCFWCAERGFLYDYVNQQERNAQLRPNQLWATALLPMADATDTTDTTDTWGTVIADKESLLAGADWLTLNQVRSILEQVDQQLFTPVGLRTLAPTDSNYQGTYAGNQSQRDCAYHNGAIWPWLLGCFFESTLKYWERARATARWQQCQQALGQHLLHEACVGSISELFSGDAPHLAGGAISQAWSVGELLRVDQMFRQAKR